MTDNFGTPIYTGEPPKKKNTTLIIVLVVLFVLLCCCCLAVTGTWLWNNGDAIMEELELYSALPAYLSLLG